MIVYKYFVKFFMGKIKLFRKIVLISFIFYILIHTGFIKRNQMKLPEEKSKINIFTISFADNFKDWPDPVSVLILVLRLL